jgi:hypothetical protein
MMLPRGMSGIFGNTHLLVTKTPMIAGIPNIMTFFRWTIPFCAYLIPQMRLVKPTIQREYEVANTTGIQKR